MLEEDIINNILTSHWTEIKEIKKRLEDLEKHVKQGQMLMYTLYKGLYTYECIHYMVI